MDKQDYSNVKNLSQKHGKLLIMGKRCERQRSALYLFKYKRVVKRLLDMEGRREQRHTVYTYDFESVLQYHCGVQDWRGTAYAMPLRLKIDISYRVFFVMSAHTWTVHKQGF